jgi:phage shock protein C
MPLTMLCKIPAGKRNHTGPWTYSTYMTTPRRLTRRSSVGRLGGVCAGLAEYFEADVTFVRLAWVIISIVPGCIIGGILAYLAAWVIMPDAPGTPEPRSGTGRRMTRSRTDRKIAGVCGGLGDYLKVDPTMVRVTWSILSVIPGSIVLGIVAYIVAWVVIPEGEEAAPAHSAPSAA